MYISTTFSNAVSQILEEKRRQTSATSPPHSTETVLAALSLERDARAARKRWCRNRKRDEHDWSDYWAPGDGKEGQGLKRKRKKKKANVANEEKGKSANIAIGGREVFCRQRS